MSTEKTRQAGAEAAQTARAQKTRRSHVQQTASEIQSTVPGISPEVASSMGAPLDPTGGYSFAKGARPVDLPMPGQVPGGGEERNQQSFDGNMIGQFDPSMIDQEAPGLADDHDQLVGEGIGPGGPPPGAPPAQRPEPQIHKAEAAPEHPVLTKLREDLGINHVKMHDVEVGKHIWTLATLSPGELAMAARLADRLSLDGITENQMNYQISVSSYSVVAIDGIPTYQVFGVEPPPAVMVANPLRPPRQIKHLAAIALCEFLSDGTRTQLPDKLYGAYVDKADAAGAVSSYLDDAESYRVRFRCTEKGCGHELWIVPRVKPGTKDIVLPFCQWHGIPMEIHAAETERDFPLA